MSGPLLEVEDLVKHFRLPGGWLSGGRKHVRAVDGVSLRVESGEVLGIVGESGCGKTTLGRLVLRLIEPTSGRVRFDGADLAAFRPGTLRHRRRDMQVVFQNPYASLDPRMRIVDAVAEPLRTHHLEPKARIRERVGELLAQVGLGAQHLDRYPHELSGGQCQRVAVARALAPEPRLLVLDEPTSSLDVSVQAQLLHLLSELRAARGLTYVFISHDLGVVRAISDRIGVMYLGKLVELGPAEQVFTDPVHPYTRSLLAAVPAADFAERRRVSVLGGNVPSPIDPPPGCRFHPRCPIAVASCRTIEPSLEAVGPERFAACHLAERSHEPPRAGARGAVGRTEPDTHPQRGGIR